MRKTQLFEVNAVMFTPVIGVMYVLGIMLDRVCYGLFYKLNERNKFSIINKNEKPSVGDRERCILEVSETLKSQISYNRSRSRICRSWVVNFIMISVLFFAWNLRIGLFPTIKSLFVSIILAILSFFSYLVWVKLSRDYYLNIKSSYNYLYCNKSSNNATDDANQTNAADAKKRAAD